MRKLIFYSVSGLLLLLISCGQMPAKEDPLDINQKGIEFTNNRKYEEALQAFLKAVKNPQLSKEEKGTIYRNISLTYNQLEKRDSAIHFSTLATKCYIKNSLDYLVNAADVDLLRGKTGPALSKLLKALNRDPDEMALNNTLGLIYMGEYDEAFIDLDKALIYNLKAFETDSGRIIEEVLARNYYRMENYEKAELHFDNLLQNYPDMTSYFLEMGMTKHKLNKKEEGNKLFEELIAKDSSYRETIDIFREDNR